MNIKSIHFIEYLKYAIIAVVCVSFLSFYPQHLLQTEADNLTSVSDTLSNSRLSFYGLMTTGNTAGSTMLTLRTSAAPSTDSAHLASPSAGTTDNVLIGSTKYTLDTVAPSGNHSRFSISAGISAGDAADGTAIIATQSATHTIKFLAATGVPSGAIRVLVKASSVAAASHDGIPDGDGFDFGVTAPAVACPTDVASEYDFVAGTASYSGQATNPVTGYHAFECRYSGVGGAAEDFTVNPMSIIQLINPAPSASHALGTADTYAAIVQNLDASNNIIDQTTIRIGVIDGVYVSATVAPQITFVVGGLPDTATACSLDLDVTTTPTTVPFGELSIAAFTEAAHSLSVSTNALSGYAVTAQMNDNLGKNGKACDDSSFPSDCIPDPNVSGMTYSVGQAWASTTNKGFAHTVTKVEGGASSAADTEYAGSKYRHFPDMSNLEPAQPIFSSSTVADSEIYHVCYKAVISSSQPAGDYENTVIYTATATF